MDIFDLYNKKNETTTIYLKTIKETFITEKNKSLLYNIISKQLYISNNNDRYLKLQKNIDNEIEYWVEYGKLDTITDTASFISNDISLQLDYYNDLFIKYYINKVTKSNQLQFELDNNPYKQQFKIDGIDKKFKDFLPNDYENISVSNYQNTYTLNNNFSRKYNKIPHYRKVLHNRNIDRSFTANDMLKNESKSNISYKRYNNDELLNGLSYLQKK
jgi:hypothetical protein